MKVNKALIWPYSIGASIILVFGFCVATIVVTSKMPVENSDSYMRYYQDVEKNANELIEAQIAFDKRYKIEYVSDGIHLKDTKIRYKITDINSKDIENAKIQIIITRPNKHKYNQEFSNFKYENGIYEYEGISLALEGRWNIIAKIDIGEFQRFYSIKADTRVKEAFEY